MNIKQLWSKRKFQNFTITHLLFALGVCTVPFDKWYIYDLALFLLFTLPVNSIIQHLVLNHSYTDFKNNTLKIVAVGYMVLNNFWKFSDAKSYHIAHHKLWLTNADPTANEVQQGILKYYVGLTDPVSITKLDTKEDQLISFVNKHFYVIKFLLVGTMIMLFGWKIFVHLILIQQFLIYVASKAHDVIFHHTEKTVDCPWLFPIYSNDAFHIEHHRVYNNVIWHWKYANLQYFYSKLLFRG